MAVAATGPHPRLLLHCYLSPELCKELEFIHRSCGTVGYRPNVLSTTLSHLAATDCGHLLLPFIPLRDRLKDTVEDFFACHFQLFVEFTALISWCKGSCIGWHSDDNRPYLKQRDFAVVCYLNSHGKDFKGGRFHFKDGEPSTVVPVAGDVLIYTADDRNIHSVEEVAQFYYWKSEELVTSRIDSENCTRLKDQLMLANKSGSELDLPCNHQLAKAVLGCTLQGDLNLSFDWNDFIQAVAKWEEYSYSLHKDLLNLIPFWLSHHAMFITVPAELQKCNKLNKPMQICEGD